MTRKFACIIALLFLSIGAFSQRKADAFVKDELLVKFADSRTESVSETLLSNGARFVKDLGNNGWTLVKITDGKSVERAIESFTKFPQIIAVQPNFYYSLQATPNDPQFGATGMYGMTRISAPQAWDITTGSSNVVVANIDTGMRMTHEDLAANIWTNTGEIANNGIDDDNNGFIDDVNGWDFRFDDSNPADEHGHGTHTGGTIGAAGNNMLGVPGVNWNVRIMVIKIYSQAANDTTSAMLINAYNYVRLMRERGVNIRVTNNSYGGCNEACSYDQATKDALDALGNADVLNVFAAGNNGQNVETTPFYPGSYDSPSILNVAASNSADNKAGFSNFGLASVDLAAPGVGTLSTTNTSNSSYNLSSGTSMAAPHVSGVAALLAAHNPSLSAASLKATLMNTVDPLAQWSTFVKTGGRMNAFAALQNQTVCSFTPSQANINARTKGGFFTFDVAAGANCDYTIATSANWITVDGPKNRSGAGQVSVYVRLNRTISRQGTITVGGTAITVNQARGQNF
jgi:subtilisin family serine protease